MAGLDDQGRIHRDLRNRGQLIPMVVSMTTQLPIDLISFKCLKLKLAFITIFSTSVITSPTDSICTGYQVANAFLACQEVGMEGLLRSCHQGWAVILPIAVFRIWNQPGFFGEVVCRVHPEKMQAHFFPGNILGNIYCSPSGIWALVGYKWKPTEVPHSGVYIRLKEQLIEEILIWK